MKWINIIVLAGVFALASLLLTGCPGEDSTVPDAGTDLPQNLLMGEICVEDGQCESGLCLEAEPEHYCSQTGCSLHADCVNHAEGEDYDMCCVEVTDLGMVCLKSTSGWVCEDPPTPIGTPCGDDPEICVGTTCIGEGEEAICTYACTTSADCYSWIPREYRCEDVGDGRYCLPYNPVFCEKSADCPEGVTCSLNYNDTGICENQGALPPGAECDETADPSNLSFEERCSGLFCFGDRCSAVCEVDDDCPEGMICEVLQFSTVEDTILVCMGDKRCNRATDCEEGEACWPTLNGAELSGWCRDVEGTDEVGTVCDEDNDLCQVFCLEGLCTEWCTADEDCPKGMACLKYSFCIAEPCENPDNHAPGTACKAEAKK